MAILLTSIECVRVSSVLNKDVKSFGKKYLTDGKEETCWNSEKGSPQWITIEFKNEETVSGFRLQFQGGFAGSKCKVKWKSVRSEGEEEFYPEDNNYLQTFSLKNEVIAKELSFIFETSTDFFGRIVVYNLEIFR